MSITKIEWKIVRFFNLNYFFRKHFREFNLDYFYIRHPAHFDDHVGYYEKVILCDYNETKKEMTVRRVNHKEGEKAFIKSVKLSQVYLNAK